jgi:hypothetical protein
MSKRNKKPTITLAEVVAANDAAAKLRAGEHYVEPKDEQPTLADVVELDPEVEADNAKPSSVVKTAYKKRYAERAAAQGGGKISQRSCWDWLAQELAAECLDGTKINIDWFLATLDANGVDHSRWTNRNKGWEGRLRMTGRLALQKVVAAQGHLKTRDGGTLEAPADWIAKHTH